MDPQLLDYYNQELTYMREAAGEFADDFFFVAPQLVDIDHNESSNRPNSGAFGSPQPVAYLSLSGCLHTHLFIIT